MNEILRVVIDTNHIIPAILSQHGASAKLIDWYLQEDYFRLLISRHIWKEYRTVADWLIPEPKLYEKERILNILLLRAEWIAPTIQFISGITQRVEKKSFGISPELCILKYLIGQPHQGQDPLRAQPTMA